MPTKDKELKESEEKPSGSTAEQQQEAPAKTVTERVQATPPWPLITIGIVATVLVAAVAVGGWLFIVGHERAGIRQAGQFGTMYGPGSGSQNGSYFGGHYRRGMMQQAAANGVVTAVNGQTLTVSGQGKQVTVTESGSTVITGDATTVAVNDTVLVYGTTGSDGSVAATRIVIRNGSSATSTGTTDPQATVPGA